MWNIRPFMRYHLEDDVWSKAMLRTGSKNQMLEKKEEQNRQKCKHSAIINIRILTKLARTYSHIFLQKVKGSLK